MEIDFSRCILERAGGVLLRVAVTPNSRRTRVDGLHDGALRLRVAAPPLEGRANDELVAWLAHELRVPRRSVRVARGATARRKGIEIDAPMAEVRAWLERVLASSGEPPLANS